jgi:hypothetical protein
MTEKEGKRKDDCVARATEKKKKKNLDDCENSHLLVTDRELPGTSWFKEGADVAVGE